MNKALVRNNRNTSLVTLSTTTNQTSNRPEKRKPKSPVQNKSVLILILDFVGVLPRNTFGTSHVLSKAVGNPWIRLKVFLQKVHILVLLLLSRLSGCNWFIDFLLNTLVLTRNFIFFSIVGRFSECVMVCVVVEGRHYYFIL